MSQMPDIKSEVNAVKERQKAATGLLGLLSRLGGGAGAAGGGGLGGAAAGGGLLATKAGVIGLVLAGTTMAGGIGVVGWNVFGPGQGDRADSPALQLFASKPKDAASAAGDTAPAAKDGVSPSLEYLAKANAPQAGPGGDVPIDQTAAASVEAPADAGGATPHMGESVASNGAAPRTSLQNTKKLGELSKSFGSGGSGGASASAAPVNAAGSAAALGSGGSKGALGGGLSRGTASNAQSIGRGLARARGGSATRQAMSVLGDNRRAFSSQSGGRTYDGGAGSRGTASVDAGLPSGGAGVGTGGGAQPTATPNKAAQKDQLDAPPTPTGKNVTPYQKALNRAQMLLGVAALLLIGAQMAAKQAVAATMSIAGTASAPAWKALAVGLASVASLLAVSAIAIGAMISGGKYGQPLQGNLIMLAGVLMAGTAAYAAYDMSGISTNSCPAINAWADMPTYMMLAGGAGLVALAGVMLTKPKSYPSSEFEGGRVPDVGYHYQVKPQERARYTV